MTSDGASHICLFVRLSVPVMQMAWRERNPEARIKAAKDALEKNPESAFSRAPLHDDNQAICTQMASQSSLLMVVNADEIGAMAHRLGLCHVKLVPFVTTRGRCGCRATTAPSTVKFLKEAGSFITLRHLSLSEEGGIRRYLRGKGGGRVSSIFFRL